MFKTAGALVGVIIFSLCVVRAWLGRWFLLSHRLLALSAIATLFWHVIHVSSFQNQLLVGLSCGVWLCSTLYRLFTLLVIPLNGKVTGIESLHHATRIDLTLSKSVCIPPGSYFNIFFPDKAGWIHSYPAVAFWHIPDKENPSRNVSNISFLLRPRGSHAKAVINLDVGDKIRLDGPFGQDLKLNDYENLVLPVKGLGIAGVLPIALDIAERRYYDDNIRGQLEKLSDEEKELYEKAKVTEPRARATLIKKIKEKATKILKLSKKLHFRDTTQKVIILWSLEHESQIEAVKDQLQSLQELDSNNVSNCYYYRPCTHPIAESSCGMVWISSSAFSGGF